jgi:hypothetical protein
MRTLSLAVALAALSVSASATLRVGEERPVSSATALGIVSGNDVRLASNGRNHYAVWRDQASRFNGALLTPDGTPLPATWTDFKRVGHDLTASGTEFLVLTQRAGLPALVVSRIDAAGARVRETAVTADAGANARIIGNGARIFVIYQQASDNALHAIVFDSSLNILKNDFAITGPNHSAAPFAAAMFADRALIVWTSDLGSASAAQVDTRGVTKFLDLAIDAPFSSPALAVGATDARLVWIGASDTLQTMPIDVNGHPGARFTAATNATGMPDVDFDGADYWLAWQSPDGCENRFDVLVKQLTGPIAILSGDRPATLGRVRITHTSDRTKFIAWSASPCGSSEAIAVGRLLVGGTINEFSIGVPDQTEPDVAVGNGTTLAVWREAGGIRIARPNENYAVVSESGAQPHIAFDGAAFLVVWLDGSNVRGRLVRPDLTMDARFDIGSSVSAPLALDWSGDTFTAFWAGGAASITRNGVVTPLSLVDTIPQSLDVASRLAVWSDGSRIDGRFLGRSPFGIADGTNPRAACNASDCLVTWSQQGNAYSRTVSLTGIVGEPRLIGAGTAIPIFDGTAYQIILSDGARLTMGGEVITTNATSVAAAANGVGATIVYTRPTAESASRAFVIDVQQITRQRAIRR